MNIKAFIERHRDLALQFFRFGVIGGIGFVVDTGMLYLGIYAFGMSRVAAGLFSFPFAVTVTWFGNRVFTFRDAKPMPAHEQLARFVLVCAIGLLFNRGTYSLLVSFVPLVYAYPVIGVLFGTGVAMFFNFFASRKHVFGM